MTTLTDVQREMLQMYALGDKAPGIAFDLNLTRANVINELSRLCGLDRERAAAVLAEQVDLADLAECTCDADLVLPHSPHLPEHVAAIAASDEPAKQEPIPAGPAAEDPWTAEQPWDNEPPITPTYVDYRANRCTDCGRTGPGPCQPGHATEPITVRIFDTVVHP